MTKLFDQRRRQVVLTGAALAATSGMLPFTSFAASKDPVKVGVIISMSGQFASTGKQVAAAIELYQKQHVITRARESTGLLSVTKITAKDLLVNMLL